MTNYFSTRLNGLDQYHGSIQTRVHQKYQYVECLYFNHSMDSTIWIVEYGEEYIIAQSIPMVVRYKQSDQKRFNNEENFVNDLEYSTAFVFQH